MQYIVAFNDIQMKRIFFSVILFLFAIGVAFADEITFVASAPNAVVVGQQFKLSYKINRGNAKEPRIPAIDGFTILMGPTRSSEMSYMNNNGQVTQTKSLTYTYILKADKEGTFVLPAATVVVDGENITSNKVDIMVLPQDKQPAAQSGSASRNQA